MLETDRQSLRPFQKVDTEDTFAIVLKWHLMVIGEIDAHLKSSHPDIVENYLKDTSIPYWMLNKTFTVRVMPMK